MRKICTMLTQRYAMVKAKPRQTTIPNQRQKIAEFFGFKVEAKDPSTCSKEFTKNYIQFLRSDLKNYKNKYLQTFPNANDKLKISQLTMKIIADNYRTMAGQAQSVVDNFASLCMQSIINSYSQEFNEQIVVPTQYLISLQTTVNNLFFLISQQPQLYIQYLSGLSHLTKGNMIVQSLVPYRVCMQCLMKAPPTVFNQNMLVSIFRTMGRININYMFHQRSIQVIRHFYNLLSPHWIKVPQYRKSIIYNLGILGCYDQKLNKEMVKMALDKNVQMYTRSYSFINLIKNNYLNYDTYNTPQNTQIINQIIEMYERRGQLHTLFRKTFPHFFRSGIWHIKYWVQFFKIYESTEFREYEQYNLMLLFKILKLDQAIIPAQIIKASQKLGKRINLNRCIQRQKIMKDFQSKQVNNKNLNCQVQIANSLRLTNIGNVRTQVLVDLFVVDILINDKFVVEVNGITHYISNLETGQKFYNPKTQFRTRLLNKLGYSVIDITLQNFNEGSFEIIGKVYDIVNDPKNSNQAKTYVF